MMGNIIRAAARMLAGIQLLVCSLISCSDYGIELQLNAAEALLQESPDSALAMLRSIQADSLKTKRLSAEYSLLFSIALDKNYIDTTDLGVIQPAFDYYTKRGTPLEKMKTNFYRGCIHYNRGETDNAMRYYLLSLRDSSKINDNRLKGLVNSAIAVIYSQNHNIKQELYYVEAALKYCNAAGDSLGVWAETGHLASCYANNNRWEDAERTYDRFFSMRVYDAASYYLRKIKYAKDLLRKPVPSPNECADIIEGVYLSNPESMTIEAYCIYAYAHQLLGNSGVADSIFEQLDTLGTRRDLIQVWRYRTAKEQGRYKLALEDLEQSVLFQDSVILASLNESLILSQRDFYRAEAKALELDKVRTRQRLVFFSVSFLTILCVLLLLSVRRKEMLKAKIEELSLQALESKAILDFQTCEINSADTRLKEKDSSIAQLRRQFAVMYKAQYKTLNDLCMAYLSPIKKERKELLYEEAMKQLSIILNDRETQNKFISSVNKSLNNIIDRLKRDLPNHKELDFRFLTYVIVGFNATTISNLTGYSIGTVYTKKTGSRQK